MSRRRIPSLSSRKVPAQARSAQMVADILEASIRVLRREGGARFTTIRVAAEAGISVGSLYQYFPNKAALLYRLQLAEWGQTAQLLTACLTDRSARPVDRLRRAIVEFFGSEAAEADLRRALDDASPAFRDSPEAHAQQRAADQQAIAFFREALPRHRPAEVAFLAQFFTLALAAIAERATDRARAPGELARWTAATADLLCAHFERVQRRRATAFNGLFLRRPR